MTVPAAEVIGVRVERGGRKKKESDCTSGPANSRVESRVPDVGRVGGRNGGCRPKPMDQSWLSVPSRFSGPGRAVGGAAVWTPTCTRCQATAAGVVAGKAVALRTCWEARRNDDGKRAVPQSQ